MRRGGSPGEKGAGASDKKHKRAFVTARGHQGWSMCILGMVVIIEKMCHGQTHFSCFLLPFQTYLKYTPRNNVQHLKYKVKMT